MLTFEVAFVYWRGALVYLRGALIRINTVVFVCYKNKLLKTEKPTYGVFCIINVILRHSPTNKKKIQSKK